MKINTRTLLVELVAGIVAMAVATTVQATNLLVYNNNDTGAGSLRQAVSDNNAVSGGNTIIFSNVVTGTITLTSGELLITKNATILGPGPNILAINGNAASRIFDITNATVVISGLTITNGSANGSSPDNSGGGILNDSFNGSATLTVSNCTVSGNSATYGGGMLNVAVGGSATLSVIASTFSGNSASTSGGGIENAAGGDATLSVIACTFSGNSATYGGGMLNGAVGGNATLSVIACTFSGNSASSAGGGIVSDVDSGNATLTIGDTILKAGTSGANITNISGTVISQGYNLSSDNGGGFLTGVGDQINTDPMLGPLQDNGGPTFTCAPLPGSPAIDQGKSFGLTTDQRGRARTFDNPAIPNAALGDGTDIGAVEVGPATLVVNNTNDNGPGSLRQAILMTSPSEATTITFSTGVSGTITLTSGELASKNATILGPTTAGVTVSGNNVSRVFHITTGGVAVIANLTIANGYAGGGFSLGGGVLNDLSTLTVSNCTLSGNSAYYGGGIFNNGEHSSATLMILNSTITSNSASGNFGGGIFNDGNGGGGSSATLTILNSTVSSNSPSSSGIYNEGLSGSATVKMGGTILNASGLDNDSGTITSLGYNLSSDNGGGFLTGVGDQINTDPMLGPLQDNGGPTFTMALRVGSPAIDKGKSFGLTTDQRGQPRPYDDPNIVNATGGDGSDIGAYEAQQLRITAVQRVANNLQISFTSMLGTNYEVQSRSDLVLGAWGSLQSGIPGNGGIANTTVNNAFSQSRQFYRIHPVP